MKRIFALLLAVLLCAALVLPVCAADIPRFTDSAGLVSESEAAALNEKLDALSAQYNFDFAVVTMPTLNGSDPGESAEYIFYQYGFGTGINRDGILLLISMEDRDWYIYNSDIISADARQYIADAMLSDLSAGSYVRAFTAYADASAEMLAMAQSGRSYKAPFPFAARFLISLVISLIVALIAVGVMKGKLKTVSKQTAAASYVVPGSLNVSQSSERYLYSNVTRTQRAQNNSSGGSRSGGGHSGSGGKF